MKQLLGIFSMLSYCAQGYAGNEVFLKAPTAPTYETCQYIKVDNNNGGTYETQDAACLNRNGKLKSDYSAALSTYNQASALYDKSTNTTIKPTPPVLEECKTLDNGNGQLYSDYSCQARNQSAQQKYNFQTQAWNISQEGQAQLTEAELAKKQAEAEALMKSQSASEALQKAIAENQKASDKAKSASSMASTVSAVLGLAYAGTCAMMGGCQQPLLIASIGFALMSALSSKQASENANSGYQACIAQNKISSATTDCGSAPSQFNISSATPKGSSLVPSVFDSNGNCVASDKSLCTVAIANLPAGTNIKDITKGASTFASPFTLNPDGSATLKGGKILKPSDFKDKNSLIAAGYSADQATAAMAAIAKGSVGFPASGLEKAAAELKDGKLNPDFAGSFMSGSGSGSESGKGTGLGSSGGLDSKNIGGGSANGAHDRNPAGEGLTRDFNGEAIGAAGDDIFSMMNRRYKMKTSQDSFISN